MTLLALGALFSVYSLTDSLKSNITATLPMPLRTALPIGIEEDADHDGLTNIDESYWATEWQNPDTDGDGFLDGEEVLSGRDPRKAGPDDLLAKTTGFIKSGQNDNLTDKLGSLITSGIYAGDLKKYSSGQKYDSAVNSLSLAMLDDGYAALNPAAKMTETVSDSKENREKYLSDIIGIFENKLMNSFLYAPYKLSVFTQTIASSGVPTKTITADLLSEAINFQTAAKAMEALQVPASWKEMHFEILNSAQSLAFSYQAIISFSEDPMKAIIAVRNIDDIYSGAPKLLLKIAKKAKEENLQIKNNPLWNSISGITNEF